MKKLTLTFICLVLAVPCQGTEYTTVDDFESYTGTVDMLVTWKKTAAPYWLKLVQTVEEGADDSNQYMEMAWNNTGTPYYSEAWRVVSDPDFTGGGFAKSLAVSYRASSASGGSAEFGEMYVRLEDSPGSGSDTDTVTLTDPNVDEDWHEWNIDLAAFDNPDLDLTDIRKIHLGVGDGTNLGYGLMYLDEIRLYALRCMPELVELDGDINNDCIVDFNDIAIIADDWLLHDYNTIGWDGLLDPDAFLPPGGWVSDPCRGNCLRFDGHKYTYDDSNDWVDIDDYALGNFQNRTIAVWVKNDDPDQEEEWRVHIFSAHSDYRIELSTSATGAIVTGLEARLEDCKMTRIPNSELVVGEWHHTALVIGNKSGDPYVYCRLYLDGVHIADNVNPGTGGSAIPSDTIPRHEGPCLRGANIGSYNEGESCFIQATLDEFRIYDYNMPTQDVNELYLGTDGDVPGDANLIIWYKFDETSGYIAEDSGRDKNNHIYHVVGSSANIVEKDPPGGPYDPDNKDIVNLLDYGALADDWLVEKLWPEP